MIKKMIYFLGSLVAVLSSWIYLKKKKQAEKLEKVSSKKKNLKDSRGIKVHGSSVIASKNNNYRLHLITRF